MKRGLNLVLIKYKFYVTCNYVFQFRELGEVPYSRFSDPGCTFERLACADTCQDKGPCDILESESATCECRPGFHGKKCRQESPQITFLKNSYAKIALSYSPEPLHLSVQLRMRTRKQAGMIIQLATHHKTAVLLIQVNNIIEFYPGTDR